MWATSAARARSKARPLRSPWGAAAYGLSVLLDAYALHHIGAAREAALFATGPFFGALAALPLHAHPHDSDHHPPASTTQARSRTGG